MQDLDKGAIGVASASTDATAQQGAPAEGATQMAMNVNCPVCHTPNPTSEIYCIDCGFLLASQPAHAAGLEIPSQQPCGKLVTPDGVREFPLNPGPNTVGRENADILLLHNTVSRKHAIITVADDRVYVEDLGSTNGTIVAGIKIAPGEKVDLADGCEIVFGSFALRYQASLPQVQDEAQGAVPLDSAEPADSAAAPSPEGEGPGGGEEPLETEAPAEKSAQPVGKLVSKDGAYAFDIHEGTNGIGRRASDNDIVISDPYCSGRHADLTFADGKFTITDVGSTNGTLVNGVRLDPNVARELSDGDEITLGRTVFNITSS